MRLRLTLSFLAVLLTGMALAGVLAWLVVEGLFIDSQRQNLLAQARLTAAALQGSPLPEQPAEPYLQTANIQPGVHSRVLGDQGAVIIGLPLLPGEAPLQVPAAENAASVPPAELLQRPEIRQALQGQAATAVRRLPAAGNRRVLYAAAPIPDAQGGVAGIVYLATPLPASSLPASALLQIGGAVMAAVLLAGAAGTLLARRIARPLEGLVEAAQAVRLGDLGRHVPVESDITELNSLGQAFNAMSASLQQSDQARNAFLADVTHELRTPLTVIKGTIETLEDGALDDAEGRLPLLAAMQAETERLIRMVNDLLVLTRADVGALQLEMRPLDLTGLARLRCEHLAPLAARRGVELRVSERDPQAPPEPAALGDPDRLAQVLDNLLDNAIRHAPEGSTVRVTVQPGGLVPPERNPAGTTPAGQPGGDRLECAVSDRGPGIPAEHMPFIFERFYRVDASRDRRSGGAGLGLAIARALVLAHGGGITARSAAGEGTTITFWLPVSRADTELPEN